MTISMHSASVPVFVRMLANADAWLDKAEAYATERKFEPQVFMTARLAPDMLPLPNQIQIACDGAKFCVARLAGIDGPKFEDTEASLQELRVRMKKTSEFVQSVSAARIDGTDDKDISVPSRKGAMMMKGETYLKNFVLPNFFFHMTTTYALLRHNGVQLGKMDFLGQPTKP